MEARDSTLGSVLRDPGFWLRLPALIAPSFIFTGLIFHQVHHSASRIEVLTSFYKHPVEILVNSFLTAVILFPVLGVSLLASFWYNFFAATGEYFYHANVRTPRWLRYFRNSVNLRTRAAV